MDGREAPYGGLRDTLWLADGWREYPFERTTPGLSTDTLNRVVDSVAVWVAGAMCYADGLWMRIEAR
ncbi:hypothetical protein [Halorubrum sp. DTA46]|uniref:hypothetical protein n=1 Tax=Halorubrum sp. DTA46 TaxID=3402162 RepID=UPI003AAE190D